MKSNRKFFKSIMKSKLKDNQVSVVFCKNEKDARKLRKLLGDGNIRVAIARLNDKKE